MQDIQLSPHFRLSEFTRSATAERLGIDNSIPSSLIPHLSTLCEHVLEPLREHANQPIIISSGYRCPELNKAVGGVKNSQHMTGEAADIVPSFLHPHPSSVLKEWFTWIMDNLEFDQLIMERASKESSRYWIHVSYREGRNRQTVVRNITKK